MTWTAEERAIIRLRSDYVWLLVNALLDERTRIAANVRFSRQTEEEPIIAAIMGRLTEEERSDITQFDVYPWEEDEEEDEHGCA